MLTALRPNQTTLDIVAALRGKWHGSYALCHCPAHADRKPSLSIRQGHHGLLVHCFAGCSAERVLRAIAQLSVRAGEGTPVSFRPQNSGNVRRIWEEAREIRDTLAAHYLQSRNLPLDLPDIRYHPRCPLGRRPNTRFLPALIVALRSGLNLTAIQRIFLRADGEGYTRKLQLGRPGSSAWRQPLIGTALAIAESVEDAAAFTKLEGLPCWSACGGERLPLLALPDRIEQLIIAPDDDQAGKIGAEKAIQAYQRPGLQIHVRYPTPFKDWAAKNEVSAIGA